MRARASRVITAESRAPSRQAPRAISPGCATSRRACAATRCACRLSALLGIRETHRARGGEMAAAETSQQRPAEKDPLRHHVAAHEALGSAGENTFGDSFMQRVADKVASGMGTVQFVIVGSAVILGWVLINGAIPYVEHTFKSLAKGGEFDAEPWILLNLIFSGVAFYTGSLVIIAAKSEAKKNAAREVDDAQRREELANTQLK